MPAQANGVPGVAAVCSSHQIAERIADAATLTDPSSLAIYLGIESEIAIVIATGDVDQLTAAARTADLGLHRTAIRRMLRHRRTWPIGTVTPSITQMYFSQRRPGLSADDYHRYWEREHRDRALRHHMGMWDYSQVSVVETLLGRHVDGITVTQWPEVEDLVQRSTNGPDGSAVIREDASRFTDLGTLERNRMAERIIVEAPWPTSGTVQITDARHAEFAVPAEQVWRVLGQFDALDAWWPGGFASISSSSEHMVGMTRTMIRHDGSTLLERLIEYRPEERMLQLTIDDGLPAAIETYTCRYEVREVTEGTCRLDWYPRAIVQAEQLDTFASVVDRGWPMIVDGLTGALRSSM